MSGVYGYGEPADWGSNGIGGGFSINDTVGALLGTWASVEQAKLNAKLQATRGQAADYDVAPLPSNAQAKAGSYAQGVGGLSWQVILLGAVAVAGVVWMVRK